MHERAAEPIELPHDDGVAAPRELEGLAVEHGAGLPTTEARAGFVDLMKRNASEIACVFVVIDGTGFWSGALRAALTGIRLLAPRSFHYSLAGSVEEVVRGLRVEHEKRTGVHLDVHELRSVITTARCADKRGA